MEVAAPVDRDTTQLDESKKAILMGIIKQIKTGSEVKHIKLPSFVLQPRSMLESMTDYFAHQHLILDLASKASPEERMMAVIQFYIAGFQARPTGVKKPFNPIIGEQNYCEWHLADGSTSFYQAEQITHHPPHTAFAMYNDAHGVYVNANITPSYVKFLGNSAETHLQGRMVLVANMPSGPEVYEMTFPSLVVKGILIGKLHMETVGKATLHCPQTGYSCKIEFKSKGLFGVGGKANGLEGKIYKNDTHLHTIKGCWDADLAISSASSKSKSDGAPFFNAAQSPSDVQYKVETPYDKLPELDSRKVWEAVARGIHNRSDAETYAAKSAVEDAQRAEEAARAMTGKPWVPQHFVPTGSVKDSSFFVLNTLASRPPFQHAAAAPSM